MCAWRAWRGTAGQWHCVGEIPAPMRGKSVCLLTCGFYTNSESMFGNSSEQISRQRILEEPIKNVDDGENKNIFL